MPEDIRGVTHCVALGLRKPERRTCGTNLHQTGMAETVTRITALSMTVIVAVFDVRKVRMAVLHVTMPVRVLMVLGQMQVQASGHQNAGDPEPG